MNLGIEGLRFGLALRFMGKASNNLGLRLEVCGFML